MPLPGRLEGTCEFVPPADIVEREEEYLIRVDLPDVRKEDVRVHAESKDGMLVVTLPRTAVEKPRPLAITIQ